MKKFVFAVLATVCLGLAGCDNSSVSSNQPVREQTRETKTAIPPPAPTTIADWRVEYDNKENARKADAFEILTATATALANDPRAVMNGWMSSIHALQGERPNIVIYGTEEAVFGRNSYYLDVGNSIAHAFLTKAENVRFVRDLAKTLLSSVRVAPETRTFFIAGDMVFTKPFKLMQGDMSSWYTEYHANRYRYADGTDKIDAPSDWTAQYGALDEPKMWWYMFLYRRYLEGGMPLVEEWQGFARETFAELNRRPEDAPANP